MSTDKNRSDWVIRVGLPFPSTPGLQNCYIKLLMDWENLACLSLMQYNSIFVALPEWNFNTKWDGIQPPLEFPSYPVSQREACLDSNTSHVLQQNLNPPPFPAKCCVQPLRVGARSPRCTAGPAAGRAGSAAPGLGVLGDLTSQHRSWQVQSPSLYFTDHGILGAWFRRLGTNFLIQEGKVRSFRDCSPPGLLVFLQCVSSERKNSICSEKSSWCLLNLPDISLQDKDMTNVLPSIFLLIYSPSQRTTS